MAKRRRTAQVRQDQSCKGRQFTAEVILWAVRWYLMFPISYRDLELMLADRGVEVAHTTLFRWIQAYAPDLEKRIRPQLRPSNGWLCCKIAAGCEWPRRTTDQAATWNSLAMKLA
jgi:transposase, IS6 family